LFTDSRDVLFYRPLNVIEQRFADMKQPLIFNGETQCWPDASLIEAHPRPEEKYRFLNSGCYMGNAELVQDVLAEALKQDTDNDQLALQKVFFSKKYPISIDYHCELFQNLFDYKLGWSCNFDVVYTKTNIYNEKFGTHPCIFHAPGPVTVLRQVEKVIRRYY